MQPKDQLAIEAARIARNVPALWTPMIAALDVLVAQAQKDCIASPPDKILVAQGRAQQITELRDTLTNAISRVSELDAKQQKLKQNPRPDTRGSSVFNMP